MQYVVRIVTTRLKTVNEIKQPTLKRGPVIYKLPREVDEKWTIDHSAVTPMPLRGETLHHHVIKLANGQESSSLTSQSS